MPAGALKGAKPGTVAAPSGTAKRTGTAAALIYEVASGDRGWDFQIVRFEIDLVAGGMGGLYSGHQCLRVPSCLRAENGVAGGNGWLEEGSLPQLDRGGEIHADYKGIHANQG